MYTIPLLSRTRKTQPSLLHVKWTFVHPVTCQSPLYCVRIGVVVRGTHVCVCVLERGERKRVRNSERKGFVLTEEAQPSPLPELKLSVAAAPLWSPLNSVGGGKCGCTSPPPHTHTHRPSHFIEAKAAHLNDNIHQKPIDACRSSLRTQQRPLTPVKWAGLTRHDHWLMLVYLVYFTN